MPVYIAAGDGLTTCIRVCSSHQPPAFPDSRLRVGVEHTFSRSIGYITECSWSPVSSTALYLLRRPHSQQCQQRRRPPCWQPAKSSAVETHSCQCVRNVPISVLIISYDRILIFVRLFQHQLVVRRHGLARSINDRLHDCRRCRGGRARHSNGPWKWLAQILSDGSDSRNLRSRV